MDQWFCTSRNFIRQDRQGNMQHIAYDKIAERVSWWEDIQAENLREEGVQDNVNYTLPNSIHPGKT